MEPKRYTSDTFPWTRNATTNRLSWIKKRNHLLAFHNTPSGKVSQQISEKTQRPASDQDNLLTEMYMIVVNRL